jgi:CheY-like chemotaxis protein
VIEIADEGPGIPPEILDRIFEPYFSTKGTGNGIGLTTAFSIIQRHSGTLTVESQVGTGTTFRITLPACHESAPSLPTPPSTMPVAKLTQTSLLVMDDEEAIRRIIRKILERAGCTVVEAADGSTATRLYEEAHQDGHPFDAVIMDLTVPGKMGGLEATSIIAKFDKDARVILASGYSSEATLDDCQEQSFVGRLTKPFTADDLLHCVSRALDIDA